MDWYLNEIKVLVSDFEEIFKPIFDNWVDESQGVSMREKMWLFAALIYFRSYIDGAPRVIITKKPTYDINEPSPIMRTLSSRKEEIEMAILCYTQKRNMKRMFKKLK